MYLHGLGIIHGDITPVGKPKQLPSLLTDLDNTQSNIFITQDGQACLGEFGIIGAFRRLNISTYDTESLEYMAPECSVWGEPSKESDVYSLALTSFSVCPTVANHPTTQSNLPITARSSRMYHRVVTVSRESRGLLGSVCSHPALSGRSMDG